MPRVDTDTPAPKEPKRLHFSSSTSVNPTCEKCGERVFPGMYEEPYTNDFGIWLNPPLGYKRCVQVGASKP